MAEMVIGEITHARGDVRQPLFSDMPTPRVGVAANLAEDGLPDAIETGPRPILHLMARTKGERTTTGYQLHRPVTAPHGRP